MTNHTPAQLKAREEKALFGLWIYILSDCVLFAGLFATYAVQNTATFGGVSIGNITNLPFVFVETLVLLTSSFACGLAVLAAYKNNKTLTLVALTATLILGLTFIGMELYEFRHLLAEGNSWSQSSFLTSYFALVGTHGLHVLLGSIWMLVTLIAIAIRGLSAGSMRKLLAFSLFWHFLDIVWIFIFTFIYLFGSL